MTPLPDVTTYLDFRKYLRDSYNAMKNGDAKFSHRYFCRKAGYGSSSSFADILAGRRNLSGSAALRLARALDLDKESEEYLLDLVSFNQADSLEMKNLHYAKLLSKGRIKVSSLSSDKYEYFSKWYHAAIRELLFFTPFDGDYKALGRKLDPSLPAHLAKKAVQLLEKLGMIAKDAKGRYRQTAQFITTDGLGDALLVENFQAETMKLAIESLDRHSVEERDMSTLTATLSEESAAKVKAAIKALRQCVLALAEQDRKVDRVVQLNIQLFPLSRY